MTSETSFWHPFADMAQVQGSEFVIERGEGSYVWDVDGNKYFDGTASLWCVNVGHGRHEIADAARAQMDTLATYQTFGGFANKPVLELADRLASSAAPIIDDAKIFFGLGGGDAIETAAKLARRYFAATGQPERVHIIGRTQGYHGTHGIGTSIGGIAANQVGMGPVDPAVSSVPWDSLEALEAEFERVGPDKVAAVFVEPVIAAGGVHRVPPGYLQGLAALCTKHGALFIADCVVAAFGRLGTMWGVDRFELRPDMMVFAKGITSGYLPLGGVVISGRIAEPFWEGDGLWFRHGQTYSGHPTCCAAALANLDILENEGLFQRGRELEDEIAAALSPLESGQVVDRARAGIGALGAISFKPELLASHPDLPLRTFAAAKQRGVLVRPLGDGVAISPSLVTTEQDLQQASVVLAEALAVVAESL